jgi:hypothetical protein
MNYGLAHQPETARGLNQVRCGDEACHYRSALVSDRSRDLSLRPGQAVLPQGDQSHTHIGVRLGEQRAGFRVLQYFHGSSSRRHGRAMVTLRQIGNRNDDVNPPAEAGGNEIVPMQCLEGFLKDLETLNLAVSYRQGIGEMLISDCAGYVCNFGLISVQKGKRSAAGVF